jgi:DASS family divalent anion:Na+ symporter
MITGWVLAAPYNLNGTAIAIAGLATLMITGVLTLDDMSQQGGTLVTFIWLAILFGMSGQLNEMGFMGYVGERMAVGLEGLAWPVAYVALLTAYVFLHFGFVSQNAQVLALLGVFLDVGVKSGVPVALMAYALLFASSYFSVITPQGGSQNIIFVASGYLKQSELYRLGMLTTIFCLVVFLVIGTPWILWVG